MTKYELLNKQLIADHRYYPRYLFLIEESSKPWFRDWRRKIISVKGNGISFVYSETGKPVNCKLEDFCHMTFTEIMLGRKIGEKQMAVVND